METPIFYQSEGELKAKLERRGLENLLEECNSLIGNGSSALPPDLLADIVKAARVSPEIRQKLDEGRVSWPSAFPVYVRRLLHEAA